MKLKKLIKLTHDRELIELNGAEGESDNLFNGHIGDLNELVRRKGVQFEQLKNSKVLSIDLYINEHAQPAMMVEVDYAMERTWE